MPYRHRLWIAAVLTLAVAVAAGLGWATPRVAAEIPAAAALVNGVAVVDEATGRPVLGLSPLTDGTVIDLTRLAGHRLALRADDHADVAVPTAPGEYTVTDDGEAIHYSVTTAPAARAPISVLFVGNSLLGSYTKATGENTPALVRRLAAAAGRPIDVTEVLHSGYTLRQTWNDGLVASAIGATQRYDYVVLQEYSTLVATDPGAATDTLLHTYAPALRRVLKPGGRVVLFKNWALADPAPFPSRAAAKAAIDEHYAGLSAALDLPNLLAPIGDEFETVIAERGASYLIVPDGKHPTDAARYLDAVTIFGIVFQESPRDLADLYLPAAEAAPLRSVAAAAIGY
ncbi:hypothetical protein ABT369_52625 [Dactylosporangium sp. NPDC000244]|uniref:hypothetical protein n=1 Tax=Dactylosporangium sp. NPDC000244 TaxID=3154365 RepID=UPI00332A0073